MPWAGVRRRHAEAIASKLQEAYLMAKRVGPGTMGHRAAWMHAEEAVEQLGEVIDCLMPLEPVVRAAGERIVGGEGRPRNKPVDPRR